VILLDLNLVIAAFREDHPHHDLALSWLERMLRDRRRFSVPVIVWIGFVRIVTNRRIFTPSTPIVDAFAFVRAMAEQPGHIQLDYASDHLGRFEAVCVDADATGDLVTDAYLAALAIEHGCTLVSLDRDFARFEGLRWERPG